MLVKRNCNYCNEEYDADTKYLKRNQGYFCSRKCSGSFYGEKRKVVHEPNTICAYCSIPIYRKQRQLDNSKSGLYFCSKLCQDLAYASPKIPVSPGPKKSEKSKKTKIIPRCVSCGLKTARRDNLCWDCKRQLVIDKWLAGDISVTWTMPRKDPKTFVKQYLIDTRGDRCEVCGFDEKHPIDGRSVITMDHIDGDYTNNHIDNLKLLCPNHHALTPTYGSRNKGNGRSYRKQYYSSTI